MDLLSPPFLILYVGCIVAVIVFFRLLTRGPYLRVQHWYKDGSFKLKKVKETENDIEFRPYSGRLKKGDVVTKVKMAGPSSWPKGISHYRVYHTAEGFDYTFNPVQVLQFLEVNASNLKLRDELPEGLESVLPTKAVFTRASLRGIGEGVMLGIRRGYRSVKYDLLLALVLGAPLGAIISIAFVLASGHWKG